ncbi:DUF7384 family protein [Natranaeroarchaeum aerophilus]|uniref:Uncharacterized protein n=1 Tax=Natranaeroarchaeum aerophilus TaxID=2917711 RepID=A0AAE3K6A9_9EURY|nr:hypothetical protein [Natranaeroarchaeum aerophilus]MCL9814736.1 hypothetical protein [Natranaeroarchaeum aerophilus]
MSNRHTEMDVDPASVVADADVLAADLLVGGPPRDALDHVRAHSWVKLVASDHLLDDATGLIEQFANERLAEEWRARIERERVSVEHPPDDHPALASAYRGKAAHVLSFDERLNSAQAGASLQSHVTVSVRHPNAFATVFDPESLYGVLHDGEYPGPDRDPRS